MGVWEEYLGVEARRGKEPGENREVLSVLGISNKPNGDAAE